LVESIRGKGGGIRLALPASEITVGRVVREAEGDTPIVECFSDDDHCKLTHCCKLTGVLDRAFKALYESLDSCTLADLVVKPQPMIQLLRAG
jgi:Rrf2 family nitric oxide-sensitive transcriptional repressor